MFRILNVFILPLSVLILIWLPAILPYYSHTDISDQTLTQAVNFPDDKVASEIENLEFGETFPIFNSEEELLIAVNSLINGKIDLPELPKLEFKLPFDPNLINISNSKWQLYYCGFMVPKILILAYDQSGDLKYLKAAKDFIIRWSDFEKSQFIPIGFLWNDHALASRASVVSEFWYRYKNNLIYNKDDSEKILHLAHRTATILANDNLYTYKTNHGVMQNLALIRLADYFPTLPNMQQFKKKANNRLLDQFNYFINEEGFVVEHSAGYHEFGSHLFKTMITLFKINGFEIPTNWPEKYTKSVDILSQLYRPDKTLPGLGDTNVGQKSTFFIDTQANNVQTEKNEAITETLLIKSGYAIWWAGNSTNKKNSQALINWSYYPYMGHKHPDELSINIWGYGQNWITNVGYWPYTNPDREKAINWIGSNAPHYVNESSQSQRVSKIIHLGEAKYFRFIELQREESSGFNTNRQLFQLSDNQWFVIDSFSDKDANRLAKVAWTLDADLNIKKLADNSFEIIPKDNHVQMIMEFILPDNSPIKTYHGDKANLFGWNASGQQIKPAHCFLVNLPSNISWSLMSARIGINKNAPPTTVKQWINTENWIITQGDELSISRNGTNITIKNTQENQHITLQRIKDYSQIDSNNYIAFLKVKKEFGKPNRPLIEYRKKVSIFTALITILLIFFYNKNINLILHISISLTWIIIAIWLNQYYFYL